MKDTSSKLQLGEMCTDNDADANDDAQSMIV